MPEARQHHYIPQCYLRGFALKKGKKRQRVDQGAVQSNIQRVMAELKGGGGKKRRR